MYDHLKMHRLWPHFVLIFCGLYSTCSARDDSLVVDTAAGSVRGRFQNVIHGLSVKQFLGIPYAQPPVGELRFARPQPAKPWNGVREAVEFGPICPQTIIKTTSQEPRSEDCLYLNVYTPSQATSQDKLAVMVWIHGGGYTIGSGSSYNPSLLVAYHDVIVVTINYRLGVLGFFNIPGTDVKGNYGMHDQVTEQLTSYRIYTENIVRGGIGTLIGPFSSSKILALKWVQQNIANFGGDPNNVTIFGESAGGMSVSHHLTSPLSKGLFQRVIAQSGSSASPFTGVRVKSNKVTKSFSKSIDCDFDNELMGCLRSKSWSDILNAQRNLSFPINLHTQPLCTVVVDGEFLPDDPRKLLNQGKINQADVMMGATANEGGLFNIILGANKFKDGAELKDVEYTIKKGLLMHQDQNKLTEDATLFEYTDHSDPDNPIKHRQAMMDIPSDHTFFAPAVFEAKALSKADVPVYFYLFDHSLHFSLLPKYVGSFHIMELFFVFGNAIDAEKFNIDDPFFKSLGGTKYSDLEVGLAHYTMRLWTTFAKHGNPNAGETTPVVTWPRYNSSQHVHLRISLNPKVEYSFRERKMAFWNEFIPKLAEGAADQESGDKKTKEDQPAKEEL